MDDWRLLLELDSRRNIQQERIKLGKLYTLSWAPRSINNSNFRFAGSRSTLTELKIKLKILLNVKFELDRFYLLCKIYTWHDRVKSISMEKVFLYHSQHELVKYCVNPTWDTGVHSVGTGRAVSMFSDWQLFANKHEII